MAVKQVLSKDFAKCWTKYMSDGASGSFLKATSAIFQRATNKHQQDCVAVVQSVLHNYVAGAPLVADELSGVATEATSTVGKQHHGAIGVTDDVIARNVSVSLAYLKLVREMQGTCIPSSTVHTLLAASKEVGSNFKNTTFSAEFQEAMRLEVESALQVGGLPAPAANLVPESSHPGSTAATGSESAPTPAASKNQLRTLSHLTLETLKAFPALLRVPIDPAVVTAQLRTLMEAKVWGSAVGLLLLYPQFVSVGLLREVIDQLCAQQDWEHCSKLCASLRLQVANAPPKPPAGNSAATSAASHLMQAHAELQAHAHAERNVSELTEVELGQLVWNLLHVFTAVNSTMSLKAAAALSQAFQLRTFAEEVRKLQVDLRHDLSVVKGKWQLSMQVVAKKSLEERMALYRSLLKHHMYSEAQMAVRRLQLVGKVAPITVAQLSDQRRRDAERYLALAIPLNRITVLNDRASLQTAADLLGISLTETLEVLPKSYKPAMTLPDLVKTMRSSPGSSCSSSSSHSSDSVSATVPAPLLPPSFRQVVGLDGEWRASMFENLEHFGCSILQIATADHVFILDMRTLCPEQAAPKRSNRKGAPPPPVATTAAPPPPPPPSPLQELSLRFLTNLMRDPHILKAGWAFMQEDIRMLRNNGRGYYKEAFQQINSYVELAAAGDALMKNSEKRTVSSLKPGAAAADVDEEESEQDNEGGSGESAGADEPASGGASKVEVDEEGSGGEEEDEEQEVSIVEGAQTPNMRSLTGACTAFLGKPLNKSQQMSDWDQRPLTYAQVQYASLDAHATLALLDSMLTSSGCSPELNKLQVVSRYYVTSAPSAGDSSGAAGVGVGTSAAGAGGSRVSNSSVGRKHITAHHA